MLIVDVKCHLLILNFIIINKPFFLEKVESVYSKSFDSKNNVGTSFPSIILYKNIERTPNLCKIATFN